MSEPINSNPGPTNSAPQEGASSQLMDESAPHHIFILKGNENSLKGAEQFLKNRGWTVASSTNLKKALLYIIQNLPTFIMISGDHPHSKVKVLPKLLKQVLPVHVIGFAESQMTASNLNLDAMKLEYSLFAPVSGPQILRIVTLIIREHNKKLTDEPKEKKTSHSNASQHKDESQLVTVKGGGIPSGHDPISIQKAREALQKVLSDEGGDIDVGGNAFFIPMDQNTPKASTANTHSTDVVANHDHLESNSTTGRLFYKDTQGSSQNTANVDPSLQAESPNIENHSQESSTNNQPERTQNGSKKGTPIHYEGSKDAGLKYSTPTSTSDAPNVPPKDNQDQIIVRRGIERYGENETLISQGVEHAIDFKTSIQDSGKKIDSALTKNTNVACIIIESPKFSGYLIAALGADRKMDAAFTRLLQRRLLDFLKTKGEVANKEDVLDLKLQEVEFQDWSIEQAEFLKKSVHEGSEIAMAFFPTQDINVQLKESKSEKMAKINLKDLKEDVPIEFDLYLHLEANDRYLLYTPQGGVFHSSQKERLLSKGITDLHLRKESIGGVKKYKAQNYLNAKIEAYKLKKKNSGNKT